MSATTTPRHWSQGPFTHVEGLDAEVDFMTWAQYQALQAAPRPTVELAECGHYQLTADGVSVDGEHYPSIQAAQAAGGAR